MPPVDIRGPGGPQEEWRAERGFAFGVLLILAALAWIIVWLGWSVALPALLSCLG